MEPYEHLVGVAEAVFNNIRRKPEKEFIFKIEVKGKIYVVTYYLQGKDWQLVSIDPV